MGSLATAIAFCVVGGGYSMPPVLACDQVDLIEINHVHDEKGHLVLDQLIFYDWVADKARYDVCAWRLVKTPIQLPRKDTATGQYVAIWRDGKTFRKVHARLVRESWTQYDPEMIERQHLAREQRRELQQVVIPPALTRTVRTAQVTPPTSGQRP